MTAGPPSFPHLSWLRFRLTGSPSAAPLVLSMESVGLTVCCTFRGRQSVRRITRGREISWLEDTGAVNVLPPDGERHTFVATMSPDLETEVFLIPPGDLRASLEADGCRPATHPRHRLTHDDPLLRSCMARLASAPTGVAEFPSCRADEAARLLLLRLVELDGGRMPDWHHDTSMFDDRTVRRLVDHIDGHLRIAPSLRSMALLVGLSPSHFAKKFRCSTGLSLHRFVNRRRVNRSLEMLRTSSASVAGVALELGFSSQSHLTQLFSSLTGMTPAKYRKQFRRTVG